MEKVGEFQRRKSLDISKLALYFILGSFAVPVCSSNSPITTMNSSSTVYTSSSGREAEFVPDAELLPSTLAQVALSPLLEASKKLFHHLPLESLFPQMRSLVNVSGNGGDAEHLNLTSALLNHSLHHQGTDDELDRIVFSNLPQGSKLVLKTVKIMKTDEDGNEEPMGDAAISLDVLPIGSSSSETEEVDGDSDEGSDKDLASDASSHKAGYDSYGTHDKEKEKKENHHRGQDYGQGHTETLTDSNGKKVTNYKGREKGLTDFDHAHGNSQSNDGERFKNSKKKNKGRKVTGFKRVYHKEEFQRTEHFYDDEEAKKIAESYGLGNTKEKAEHGKKGDDRKYHGDRAEYTDGEKAKDEHSTHHGHHKGYNVAHENTEKQKQGQLYSSHQHQQPRHPSSPHQPQQYHHPNHRYNGAYSNPQLQYNPSTTDTEGSAAVASRTPFGPKLKLSNLFTRVEATTTPAPLLDEGRIFRVQKHRFSPEQQLSYYYAPNFGPTSTTDRANPGKYFSVDYNDGFGSRANASRMLTTPRMRLSGGSRYAGKYRSPMTYDSPGGHNSLKMKNPGPFPPYYAGTAGQNLISIDKAVLTQFGPSSHSYPSGPGPMGTFLSSGYVNWNPVPSGSALRGQNFNTTGQTNGTTRLQHQPPFPAPPISGPSDKNGSFLIQATSQIQSDPSFGWETTDLRKAPRFPPPPPPLRLRDPRLFPERPVPYARLKSNGQGLPIPPPPVPNLPVTTSYYYGPTLIPQEHQQHSTEEYQESPAYPPPQSSPNYGRRGPPSFSNFMNGLMNSVSEFFNRMG